MQATASIPAYVDHHTFAIVVFAHQVGVDFAERGVVHRTDVHIAEASITQAVDVGCAAAYPSVIQQGRFGSGADRAYCHFGMCAVGSAHAEQCCNSATIGEKD